MSLSTARQVQLLRTRHASSLRLLLSTADEISHEAQPVSEVAQKLQPDYLRGGAVVSDDAARSTDCVSQRETASSQELKKGVVLSKLPFSVRLARIVGEFATHAHALVKLCLFPEQ